MNDFRIGFGYDIHQLKEKNELILGGIEIPSERGTVGHSDADVLVHSIIDAMFGALALGDIGAHFPDTDPAYKGISSEILLRIAYEKVSELGYSIGNIDSTIVLQSPKLKNFLPAIVKNLVHLLNLEENQLSVKATTSEMLGFAGREEGIKAYAVILLTKN